MQPLKRKTLMRNIQEQIAIMKKLDPKGCDPDVFERTLQKAKAIIYGSKEANGLIKDDDTERMDTMEKTLERVIEDLEDRR